MRISAFNRSCERKQSHMYPSKSLKKVAISFDHDPILFSTANPEDEVFERHRVAKRIALHRVELAFNIVCGNSRDSAIPAGRKKESNAAFHVRSNLGIQRLKRLAKQRSQQQGKQHQILEESRRCSYALGSERR